MRNCPSCGSPLQGDEIFCLQCGQRLVDEPTPRPRLTVPAAIVVGIALVAVVVVFVALERVESDAERQATRPAPVVSQPPPAASGQKPTDVAAWPAGTSAYTVVLGTAASEAEARTRATAAVGGGVPAGVLDSGDYPALEPGPWVLFAGRFDTREEAAIQAGRYAGAGFPDAAPHFVSDTRDPRAGEP